VPATEKAIELARAAAAAAVDVNAEEIIAIDVADRLALTDVFLIASGSSERQVRGIADRIEHTLRKEHRMKLKRREGYQDLRWVLLDFDEIVVHVQHAEDREFYDLERLWKDCPFIDLPGVPAPEKGSDESSDSEGDL